MIAVSPYHLATREAAAMAALVLGSRVITIMPRPAAGTSREDVKDAVERAPRYLRLMESWRWSGPLWQCGVLSGEYDGDEAAGEVEGVYESIRTEETLAPLRPLTRRAERLSDESADSYLDAVSADVLRGGPDPGINIPLSAALDRFAVRHNLVVARGAVASVAQRAESRLGVRVFSIAVPMLVQAGGRVLMACREALEQPLERLRRAIADVAEAIVAMGPAQAAPLAERVIAAAAEYTRAFEAWGVDAAHGDDENGRRIVTGYLSITGVLMPADAVLRSSRAAVRAMTSAGAPEPEPLAPSRRPARPLFTLVVREMNIRPERVV